MKALSLLAAAIFAAFLWTWVIVEALRNVQEKLS